MTADHDPLVGDPITEIALRLTSNARDVAQLDVSTLLDTPDFWDTIPRFALRLGGMINHYNQYWTAWHDLPHCVKALVLQDRVGTVVAFGQRGAGAAHTFYLIITPNGLKYCPALTQQQIDDAGVTAEMLEQTMLDAMERQLPLFEFMTTWVTNSGVCTLTEHDGRLLQDIRQTLWELSVRTWAPTERLARLNTVGAAYAAIARSSSLEPEDLLVRAYSVEP